MKAIRRLFTLYEAQVKKLDYLQKEYQRPKSELIRDMIDREYHRLTTQNVLFAQSGSPTSSKGGLGK